MSDLLTSPICLNQPNKQGGNSIYRIYIYKYIYIYIYFSFLPLLPTLLLFQHEDKTKKSTISNQNEAPDMLLRKNTI